MHSAIFAALVAIFATASLSPLRRWPLGSTRWRKLWRDLWLTRGRTAMMVVAVAVSIFGVGTVLSANAILTR